MAIPNRDDLLAPLNGMDNPQVIPEQPQPVQPTRFPASPVRTSSLEALPQSTADRIVVSPQGGGTASIPYDKYEQMQRNRLSAEQQASVLPQVIPPKYADPSKGVAGVTSAFGGDPNAERLAREAEMGQRIKDSGATYAIQKELKNMESSGSTPEEIEDIKKRIRDSGVRTSGEALKALRNIRSDESRATQINNSSPSKKNQLDKNFTDWVSNNAGKSGASGERATMAQSFMSYMTEGGDVEGSKSNYDLMSTGEKNQANRLTKDLRTASKSRREKIQGNINKLMESVSRKREIDDKQTKFNQEQQKIDLSKSTAESMIAKREADLEKDKKELDLKTATAEQKAKKEADKVAFNQQKEQFKALSKEISTAQTDIKNLLTAQSKLGRRDKKGREDLQAKIDERTATRDAALESMNQLGKEEASQQAQTEQQPERRAPQAAIDRLTANPSLAEDFKAMFGYLPEGF